MDLIRDSLDFVQEVWRGGAFGAPYIDLLIALGIVAAAVLLRGIIAGAIVRALGQA